MRTTITWISVPAALIAAPAHATQYLTVEQAQQALFPSGTRFVAHPLDETRAEAWEALAGEKRAGWFFVDRVIGKHELITYALAIDAGGKVRGIEILDYRESRGGEIRDAAWRQQFVGKKAGDELQAGADIRNISGATLSCRHVTNGVKRLLELYAAKLK
jgi:hypothetical protein